VGALFGIPAVRVTVCKKEGVPKVTLGHPFSRKKEENRSF
jgi:hypothetical protein